jgi:hypothetical protein
VITIGATPLAEASMPDLAAPDYQIARFVIERGLGAIYLIAFLVAARHFPALLGEDGLEPAPRILRATTFWQTPSIFHWGYSDRRLKVVAWTGVAVAAAVIIGLPQAAPLPITMLAWFVLWVLYQSIANVGGSFYSFGWESMLLEAGFLAVFLGNAETAPAFLVILAFRWLAFRVEFGAGMIKLRGDECWRSLTCLDYHHETQPMPNPLSWYFHHLPRPIHRVEALGQLRGPAGPFLRALPATAIRIGCRAAHDRHPALPRGERQLCVAELDHHRRTLRGDLGSGADGRPSVLAAGDTASAAGVVRGSGTRPGRADRGAQLPARKEPVAPAAADERLVRPISAGEHLWRLRVGQPGALRGHRRGH